MSTTLDEIVSHGQLAGVEPPAPKGASLEGFGNYAGMSHLTHLDDGANEFLGRLQTWDPNAKWVDEGDLGENPDNHQWRLQFDQSKLPKNPLGNQGFFGMQDVAPMMRDNGLDAVAHEGHLLNPKAVAKDPTYGYVTSNLNNKHDFDWLDLGPMFVGLFAGGIGALAAAGSLGSGAAAASAASAAATAAGEGGLTFTQASSLANAVPSLGRGIDAGDPLAILSAIAGPAGAVAGVPSYLTALAKLALNKPPPKP